MDVDVTDFDITPDQVVVSRNSTGTDYCNHKSAYICANGGWYCPDCKARFYKFDEK